ncbi:hypothetical protein [Azonexus hydrophilus]|uniref:hypothetical protein n=1 Tax=Azonexus hydrophilus TaxID=418702 RepID=UPI001963E89D|nr:hypothetical protein [Azonexus hydrophilus]
MNWHEQFWGKWNKYWETQKLTKPFEYKGKCTVPGGFIDVLSFVGLLRGVFIGVFAIFFGRYIDLYLAALDPILGREVTRGLEQMRQHARLGLFIGSVGIFLGQLE